MSVFIKGLNIKPCKDGFDGKGLVIIGYDDKLYAVAHEQIIPLPDHGDLIDRDAMAKDLAYDVELDDKALDDTNIVGREREYLQFDKDCKQNCMYYLTEQEAVIPAERS